jgi:feruloyl esterase
MDRTVLNRAAPPAAAMLLAACAAPTSAPPQGLAGADPKAACEVLKGATIAPERIVWPGLTSGAARVDSAELVEPAALAVAERGPTPAATITPATPRYCKVLGRIAPVGPQAEPIRFQVNLPLQWNARSVQFGGGGFNGVLITGLALVPGQRYDVPAPLAQGYVTVGTDSGHQTKPNASPMAFALDDEMLVNFAHAAYPKVRNVSVELMQRAYGRAPEKLYFVGSSEGGREGLTMAQRYPAAFDGIFSRVPVIHWTGLQFAGARNGMALMEGGWLNAAQVKLVHDATLAACDAIDGAADRVVAHPAACLKQFHPASLRCGDAAPSDRCLTDVQVRAVLRLRTPFGFPYPLANGLTTYPGWGIGGEDTPAFGPTGGWRAWWTGNGAPAIPPAPPPASGIAWFYGAGALQYFYARDPQADPRTITPESVAARVREVSALMDSTNPDLSAFHARGGKLVVLEYLSDYAQSPYAGIQYVESVKRRLGEGRAAEFVRLYTAPGVDHVGTGAPALTDPLGALSAWVEKGRAPAGLTLAEQDARPPFAVTRTRPLCEWPAWPRYRGQGDAAAAASFECVQ